MASRIITKKGSGAPLASDLVHGELAVDTVNKRLYTENAGGTVIEVGTSPSTIDINGGTIDDTVIGGTTAAAGTFTTFTSTGIDDNATSTAITIDASRRVNIAKSSTVSGAPVEVQANAAGQSLNIYGRASDGVSFLGFFENNSNTEYASIRSSDASNLILRTGGSDRVVVSATGIDVTGTVTADGLVVDGAAVFNEGGADVDFRVESDTNTHALFVQGSDGNVGIGTTSPSSTLSVRGAFPTASMQRIGATGAPAAITLSNNTDNGFYVAGSDTTFTIGKIEGVGSTNTLTEAMRIDSSRNLLVGTTSNVSSGGHVLEKNGNGINALEVTNSATSTPYGPWFRLSNASPNNATVYFLFCSDNTATRASILSNGGFANYQANDTNLSDERVKTDIAPLGSMWDKFKALEIVTFKYKDQTHDDNNIGVIAQQVEAVAPEFVDNEGFGETPEGETPLKAIYTADLYHAAIKALQEAMTRIETLEAEVAALKGAN